MRGVLVAALVMSLILGLKVSEAVCRADLLAVAETGVATSKGGRGGGGSPGLHKRSAEGWGYRPGRFHLPCWREGKALSNISNRTRRQPRRPGGERAPK